MNLRFERRIISLKREGLT